MNLIYSIEIFFLLFFTTIDEHNDAFVTAWHIDTKIGEVEIVVREAFGKKIVWKLTFWRRNFFQILAHRVFKM